MHAKKNSAFTAVAFVLGIATLLAAPLANAYAVKTTSRGWPVRWNSNEVRIVLDSSLAAIGPQEDIENLVISAFYEWTDAAQLPVEFSFVSADCGGMGHDSNGDNENCVLVDSAAFEGSKAAARCVMTYDDYNGNIKDADIIINPNVAKWALDETQEGYDLRTAVLHEVGHLLGLSHSEQDPSVMTPEISTHRSTRNLFNDDIDGASVLYNEMESFSEYNCSVTTPGKEKANTGLVFFLLFIGLVTVRRFFVSGVGRR
ncbi:MAG: matrixin family metalloprotease [Deltaproteobacteria bacterium]|nr:matrixin family metalloprotease [Deltaproteobacteria bacterium]